MNLPTEIYFYNGHDENQIHYIYTADGTKLRQFVYGQNEMGVDTKKFTDYIGNMVYEDEQLSFILIPDGRIVVDPRQCRVEYFIKDHLGNTRSVVDAASGKPIEENSYYPFGMQIEALSRSRTRPENRYKYNGKELTSDFGLDWYDYGARFYDPQIARWSAVDPLAEEYLSWSPYNYTMNNPIRFVDPNGMWVDDYVFDENGTFVRKEENDEPDKIVIENSTTGNIDAELEVGPDETLEDNFYQIDNETGFKNITDHNQAKNIFEFFADNTDVEWGWGETPVATNDVFTVNGKKNIQVPSLEFYDIFTHNHPSGKAFQSGMKGNDGDTEAARRYPDIKYYIYVKGNNNGFPKGYYNFDKMGLNPKHLPDYSKGHYKYVPINSKDF